LRKEIDFSINDQHLPSKKQNNDKTYDILILDKNSDLGDYETSASMVSNAKLNRSFNSPTLAHEKRRRRRNDRYSNDYK